MGDSSAQRAERLRSALDRLGMPIIICEEDQRLQPLNTRGTALFETENLRGEHPLSRLIAEILQADVRKAIRRRLTFPSGRQFIVESSGRSGGRSAGWSYC
jgi:hypothetical protein